MALAGYHPGSVSELDPAPPVDRPVDPLFSHAASPFVRTEAPAPVAFASPPDIPQFNPAATLLTYKTQIQFGLAVLAYLMVLVGSVTVVQGNPEAGWKYLVAAMPVVPAGGVIWLTANALSPLEEVQKRTQMQSLGFSMAETVLTTVRYGVFEGA